MKTVEDRFKEGIRLRNKGLLKEAIDEFLSIINEFPDHPKISGIYAVTAGIYYKLNDLVNSFKYSKEATELAPKAELASFILYLTYVRLNEIEKAIQELSRYLSLNKADMYKVALEELLQDVAQGNLPKYRETILGFAKKNNIQAV